ERAGLFLTDASPVTSETESPLRLGQKQRRNVRGRRDLVAGPQLLRDAGPAGEAARLDHGDLVPRLGEERRAHAAVVARADDDDVASHALFPLVTPRPPARRSP